MDWLYLLLIVLIPVIGYYGPRVFRKPHEGD